MDEIMLYETEFPGIYVTEDGYLVDEDGSIYDGDGDLIEEDALIINEGYVNEMNWGKISKKLAKASDKNFNKASKAYKKAVKVDMKSGVDPAMKYYKKAGKFSDISDRQMYIAQRAKAHQRMMAFRKSSGGISPAEEFGKTTPYRKAIGKKGYGAIKNKDRYIAGTGMYH